MIRQTIATPNLLPPNTMLKIVGASASFSVWKKSASFDGSVSDCAEITGAPDEAAHVVG